MGSTGDEGHFDALADLLADEFTVITYDRRGNGRSPTPPGWTSTSPEEQADDAAALVDSLVVGLAAVFGTSSRGNFALRMLTRHPLFCAKSAGRSGRANAPRSSYPLSP